MEFKWQNLSGAWERAVLQLNQRLGRLAYILESVYRGSGFLRIGTNLHLSRTVTLYSEGTAPAAPAAERAVLFLRVGGGGKMELCIRYPGGAINVIDTEP